MGRRAHYGGGGGGGAPSGAAGGGLSGTYPNPATTPSADNTTALGTSALRYTTCAIATSLSIFAAAADANATTVIASAAITMGAGGASAVDVKLARTAANVLTLDNAAGGSATLRSPATLTINSVTSTLVQTNGTTALSLGAAAGDFLAIGATPALTGAIRLDRAGAGIVARGGGVDVTVIAPVNVGGNSVQIGDSGGGTAQLNIYASTIQSRGTTTVRTSGANVFGIGASGGAGAWGVSNPAADSGALTLLAGATITSCKYGYSDLTTNAATGANNTLAGQSATGTTSIGGDAILLAGTGTTNYGQAVLNGCLNMGRATQAMADAAQTLSVANSAKNIITVTGTNTGVRALTISRPPTAGTCVFIDNQTAGFGITVQFLTGAASATIPIGKDALVYGDGTNAVAMTWTN